MTPDEIFNEKWPRVRRLVDFRARRWALAEMDADDVLQLAALILWRQCRRGVENVNAMVIAVAAWDKFREQQSLAQLREDRRLTTIDAASESGHTMADDLPARDRAIRLKGGGRYTLVDARMDEPAAFDLLAAGDTGPSGRARALGISRQRVDESPRKYGGVLMPTGKWRYPAAAVQ